MRLRKKGYALATILILMGVSLFGVGALVSISALEAKISRSQREGITAYYAADAGIVHAVNKLKTDTTLADALRAGTLSSTYTAANTPQSGQGFTVTMATDTAKGAGYGTITVDATADNGTFTAKRKVTAEVYSAPTASTLGNASIVSGFNMSFSNGSSTAQIPNSDIYTTGNMTLSNANMNLGTGKFASVGNYTRTGGTVVSGGVNANNVPPPPGALTIPTVDFSYYQTNANATYTGTAFRNLIQNGGTITLPGPITYVSSNFNLTSVPNNTVVNLTGMLVFGGNFSVSSAVASRLTFNVLNPGNNVSGILVGGNTALNGGRWIINGVFFGGGNVAFTSVPNITINGGLVCPNNMAITTGATFSVNINTTIINTVFNLSSTPSVIEVQHWEEEY
jgi:Tfp pilus assembly protein PilX